MRVEVGSTGLRRSGDYIQHDYIPQLNGRQAAEIYEEMGNDPLLGGILWLFEMLMRRVKWTVEPPETQTDSQAAKDGVAFTTRMLFEDLARPFPEVIGEVASMFQFGYAPIEVTYALAEDGPAKGQLVVQKLDLRLQRSIVRWHFDDETGAVLGCWQQDTARRQHGEVFIPRHKLALFRTTTKGDNPEGRSLLRACYKTYMRNQVLQEAEARAALRASGFVLATVPGALLATTASPEEKARLAAIKVVVENLAADRQGAVILPSDVDRETKQPLYGVSYVVADGQRSADMSPLIERGDKRMAGSLLAEFMLLGLDGGGSLALGQTKTQLFLTAVQGMVDIIAAEFNRAVIAPWWRLRGEDPAIRPVLKGGGVGPADLTALAGLLTQAIAAGVITADDTLEAFVRSVGNLPKHDKTTARKSPAEKSAELSAQARASMQAGATRESARTGAAEGAAAGRRRAGARAGAKQAARAAADAGEATGPDRLTGKRGTGGGAFDRIGR
jgi:hypothetical protein